MSSLLLQETASLGREGPSFLILGTVKGGTTTLYQWLTTHPEISAPDCKELNFFEQDNQYSQGLPYYHQQFQPAHLRGGKIAFEATPTYLYHETVPVRLQAYNPSLKFIILLRDPISRAYSHWNMFRFWCTRGKKLSEKNDSVHRQRFESLMQTNSNDIEAFSILVEREMDFIRSAAVEDHPIPVFIRYGLYYQQIKRYFELFPRNQFLILGSHELQQDRIATLNKVTNFLEITPFGAESAALAPVHVLPYCSPMPQEIEAMLREFYKPHNQQLYEYLRCHFGWDQ